MHEFALAADIVRAATGAVGPRRVDAVHVTVERFGHIDAATLAEAFAIAAVGTRADGAALVIDAPTATCEQCGEQVEPGEWPLMCRCGAVLLHGEMPELAVTAVEVRE